DPHVEIVLLERHVVLAASLGPEQRDREPSPLLDELGERRHFHRLFEMRHGRATRVARDRSTGAQVLAAELQIERRRQIAQVGAVELWRELAEMIEPPEAAVDALAIAADRSMIALAEVHPARPGVSLAIVSEQKPHGL